MGAGAALLLSRPFIARTAAATEPVRPVRIAILDNDTQGAVRSYQTFMAALEKRFANTQTRFEPMFIPLAVDTPQSDLSPISGKLLPFKADFIFASNDGIALRVAELNTGKPVIFYSNLDPVAVGLTDSLTRPNKGMTGFVLGSRIAMKRREMLLRLAPQCRVMGLLTNGLQGEGQQRTLIDPKETFPGLEERRFSCVTAAELDVALRSQAARAVTAWDVEYTMLSYRYPEDTVRLFSRTRLPVIYPRMKHIQMGGMAAYVPKIEEADDVWVSQLASLMAGVPVADIPVVQATRYSFGLNLKACHHAGVTPSKALIKIADVVIE